MSCISPKTINFRTKDPTKDVYSAPSMRQIATNLETSFLASNLEPIGGGDDPDIDW